MKADTPVPKDMDYIDIPANYVIKGFMKRKQDYDKHIPGDDWLIKLESVMEDELSRRKNDKNGWLFLMAEVYPKPAENGDSYIGLYAFGKTEGIQ